MKTNTNNSPVPPSPHDRLAGHHWLKMVDSDGHCHGWIVLQWAPGIKGWVNSNNVGTGAAPLVVAGWEYVEPCPILGLSSSVELFGEIQDLLANYTLMKKAARHKTEHIEGVRQALREYVAGMLSL